MVKVKIVQKYKGMEKTLHGIGNLTISAINSMQNYYGIAIRNNTNNLYAMEKAVGAVLWHCTNFSDNSIRHSMCPRDEHSWCKWQLDKLKGTNTHTNKISLSIFIHNIIRPIFQDLSVDDLLRKCLHGQTQNSNEAFHSILWTRCPKNIFVSRRTFETCINSAIIDYNDGGDGKKSVLSYFGLLGSVTIPKLVLKDQKRFETLNKRRRSTSICKKQRKKLKPLHMGYLDTEKTDSYSSGGF